VTFLKVKRKEEDLYVNTDYKVLYEDDAFLAVEKPSPLPVHPVGSFVRKNLLSILEENISFEGDSLKIVNRLDSETSGVMLVAKTSEAAGRLARQFENRTVEKEYTAVVFGAPKDKKGKIDISLGSRVENTYHLRTPDPKGQAAETRYEVLHEADGYSLLKLAPLTGRMHQIRAHLAFFGHPIVGDKIYIDLNIFHRYVLEGWKEDMEDAMKLPRLALHATKLAIRHPESAKKMEFISDIPKLFNEFLAINLC